MGRPAGAKTGTTSDYRDTWTMGFTTDLAVGVWVGNSNNTQMDRVLGAAGPAPIWHRFMVEVHQRPELARHLLDPSGQPYPAEFARPEGIVEAEVCTATGKKPTAPGTPTRKDLFVKGREPAHPCDELTPEENDELAIALRSTTRDAAKFAPGGVQSVQDYRKAVKNFRPPGGAEPGQPSPSPQPTPTPPRR